MANKRAILHIDENGMQRFLSDEGVDFYIVDEREPDDRIYLTRGDCIPDGMLDGEVGRYGEGLQHVCALRTAAEVAGKPPLGVIEGGKAED